MLPDLISGRIRDRTVAQPLLPLVRRWGVDVHQAEVHGLDADAGRVVTDLGTLDADIILLCIGCETNYFGQVRAPQATVGLKSIAEGQTIRRRADAAIDRACDSGQPAQFLVVGGGYTGFEAASQLALRTSLRTGLPLERTREVACVRVLELSDTVLRNVAKDLRSAAREMVERFGVDIRTETTVEAFAGGPDDPVRLTDGSTVDRAVVVWTPGVAPGPMVDGLDVPRVAGGRMKVEPSLQLAGRQRVLAAGDVAGPILDGADQPLRLSIQFALAGGRHVADNALRLLADQPLKAFSPRDPGYVVPLTPGKACGSILGIHINGRIPNALHYFMCMLRSWTWAQRGAIPRNLAGARRRATGEASAGGSECNAL